VKPRNTAALALVGWNLMVPPLRYFLNPNLPPFSQWEIRGSFDTADACTAQKAEEIEIEPGAEEIIRDGMDEQLQLQIASQMAAARCIASDDPRLKEK
jgi:hypothetical protein